MSDRNYRDHLRKWVAAISTPGFGDNSSIMEVFMDPRHVGSFPQFKPTATHRVLAQVLSDAYDQSAVGKGMNRHGHGKNFEDQFIVTGVEKFGTGGPLFQAVKKIQESRSMDPDRAIHELRGAIVYIAGTIAAIDLSRQANAAPQAKPPETPYPVDFGIKADKVSFADLGIPDGARVVLAGVSIGKDETRPVFGFDAGSATYRRDDLSISESAPQSTMTGKQPPLPGCETPDNCVCAQLGLGDHPPSPDTEDRFAPSAGRPPFLESGTADLVNGLLNRGVKLRDFPDALMPSVHAILRSALRQ